MSEPSRKRRIPIVKITLGLLALGLATVGVLAYLLLATPGHVRQAQAFIEQTPQPKLSQIAESLEQRFTNRLGDNASSIDNSTRQLLQGTASAGTSPDLSLARNSSEDDENAPQTITMSYDEINAWLSQRLDSWVRNQGGQLPQFARDYLLTHKDGRLALAFRMSSDGISGWVSVFLKLQINTHDTATVTVTGIEAGHLRMPSNNISLRLREYAKKNASSSAKTLADAFNGKSFDPVFPMDRKTDVRVTDISTTQQGITVTIVKEKR
ncbi:hypothetical protein [Mucisphaera calidilacus]|uniref:Uncharacterized protein n=1 Tax=Mucisphaera calidilacus TaxID=2527982 RepID=A0A518BV94_9BACT|nr:hypothetical protein [Mucisphaera calidilacus]QDU70902.1 hypothetical protein Pan265_07440 [Mucisphaera calidilacus]